MITSKQLAENIAAHKCTDKDSAKRKALQYYYDHKDRYSECRKARRNANLEESRQREREYMKNYRAKNLEKMREYARQYAKDNPEKIQEYRRRIKAKKLLTIVVVALLLVGCSSVSGCPAYYNADHRQTEGRR